MRIAELLRLPCGATLPNRLAKGAMTEGLATANGVPTTFINSSLSSAETTARLAEIKNNLYKIRKNPECVRDFFMSNYKEFYVLE